MADNNISKIYLTGTSITHNIYNSNNYNTAKKSRYCCISLPLSFLEHHHYSHLILEFLYHLHSSPNEGDRLQTNTKVVTIVSHVFVIYTYTVLFLFLYSATPLTHIILQFIYIYIYSLFTLPSLSTPAVGNTRQHKDLPCSWWYCLPLWFRFVMFALIHRAPLSPAWSGLSVCVAS